ncbi:MAG: hypothetical protein SFU56_04025 [Capsulimonadales bacterium]|nr:hypothetical protein [Capsulimonadales bacterium]
MNLLHDIGTLFVNVLVPILLLVAAGALVQRFHPLDMGSLSKLQTYSKKSVHLPNLYSGVSRLERSVLECLVPTCHRPRPCGDATRT